MAGGYSVTISAVDAASPALEGFNKRFDAMRKRVEAAAAPFKRLGDQMNRFSEVTGIDKIATGFKNFGVAAGEAWRSVSRIVEPLAAITGAASIAGIVRLTQAWADFGTTLGNQASRAGVSADQLYNLQNAARLAGVDAGTLTASLTTMNDRMRDAAFGGAPSLLPVLRNLGLSFEELNRQKPEERLRIIADALNRVQNPTDRAHYMNEIFGGEGMQAFLQGGAEGIARYEQQARRLAGVFTQDDVDRANAFRMAQVGLVESLTGLGNVVSATVAPGLTQLLGGMSDVVVQARKWVEANEQWISQKISDRVGEFVTWLKQVDWVGLGQWIHDIATRADAVAQALGGWQTVGEGLLLFFAGSWLAGMLLPFVTIGLAIGRLTWSIGTGLVGAFGLAGKAAEAFSLRAMALPIFGLLGRLLPLLAIGPAGGETLGSRDQFGDPIAGRDPAADRRPDALQPVWNWIGGLFGARRDAQQNGGRRSLGGWEYGGEGLPPSTPGPSSQERESRLRLGRNILMGLGWNANQSAGIMGGLLDESGLNPGAVGDSGQAYGIAQVHPARRAAIEAHYRRSMVGMSFEDQVRAVDWELRNSESAAADRIRNSRTAAEAGYNMRYHFERPLNREGDARHTAAVAAGLGRLWENDPPRSAPIMPDASGAPALLPSSQPGSPGANGKVDMNVRVLGQPAVVTSRTSGDVDLKVVSPALTGY